MIFFWPKRLTKTTWTPLTTKTPILPNCQVPKYQVPNWCQIPISCIGLQVSVSYVYNCYSFDSCQFVSVSLTRMRELRENINHKIPTYMDMHLMHCITVVITVGTFLMFVNSMFSRSVYL